MIRPISLEKSSSSFLASPLASTNYNYPSSLCSSGAPSRSFLYTLFLKILSFFKSLFLCGVTVSPIKGEDLPEIDPQTISEQDPFRNQLFVNAPNGKLVLRAEEAFQKTSQLFRVLGTTSYYSWVTNGFSLWKREAEVISYKTPPLDFLYFVLFNRVKVSYIHHFKNQSSFAWSQFLTRLSKDFEKSQESIEHLLPGFCKALSLDVAEAKKLAGQNQWQTFILWVFNTRKNHFNLN